MAYTSPAAWYVNYGNGSSTGWFAVTAWATGATKAAGALVRQSATPTVGNERIFVCIIAGTTHATTEPTWVVTKGAKTTDNTVTWQECTGQPGVNGDISAANCPQWTISSTPALGFIIYDPTSLSLQICSTSGAGAGVKPTFSATAGTTTADSSATWTSLGLASGFAAFAAPHSRLANAVATNWLSSGTSSVFVADNHAETQASAISIVCTSSATAMVYCVDHTASMPPTSANLMTSATLTTTGANNLGLQSNANVIYLYGLNFVCGNSGSPSLQFLYNGNQGELRMDTCSLAMGVGTTGGGIILCNNGHAENIVLNNVTMSFNATAQGVNVQGPLVWKNTASALLGAAVPTSLFNNYNNSIIRLEGIDLSAATTGKTIFYSGSANTVLGYNYLLDCKLGSGVTIAATPSINAYACVRTDAVCSDSAGTNYQKSRFWMEGTLLTETVIVRTGGASNGTTAISDKITTQATNVFWIFPFQSIPIAIWNAVTGTNRVVTLYGIWNAAAVPNNDDIWIEAEYFGSASTPQASFANNTKANNLATGTGLTADSTSAWDSLVTARANTTAYSLGNVIKVASNPGRIFFCTTAGTSNGTEPAGYASAVDGGSVTDNTAVFRAGVRFSLAVTLSSPQPAMAGPIYVTVNAAKVSSTFYVDPLITLS